MTDVNVLCQQINERHAGHILSAKVALGELTIEVTPQYLLTLCRALRDEKEFACDCLVDVCGVDYLHYGIDDWQTDSATGTGFGRGVSNSLENNSDAEQRLTAIKLNRFSVVYHLLSLKLNHRIRVRLIIPNEHDLLVDSVIDIWPSANWFERETFDLFGILFRGHPDLRRILTDYGFVGHPFRKDFPLIGKVEARYDAALKRVVYEPVSIEARVLEPKVIRRDNRYLSDENVTHGK